MIIAGVHYSGGNPLAPLFDLLDGVQPEYYEDSSGNWELVFKGTATVRFRRLLTDVDVFAVGGGQPGASGTGDVYADGSVSWANGGKGGKGGECVTEYGKSLETGTSYQVTIGTSGLATSAFGITADTGKGSAGGRGSVAGGQSAGNGADGVLAFGDENTLFEPGRKYGPGGGGGGAAASVADGSKAPGNGGETGGGKGRGAGSNSTTGLDGAANTGGGGGGGSSHMLVNEAKGNKKGGDGGSGIVIIRNAREREET